MTSMKQKGFTLIELLVVIAIIVVLSTVAMTSYRSASIRARDSRRQADVQQVRSALELYRTDKGYYPLSCTFTGTPDGNFTEMVTILHSGGYLPSSSITDPGNNVYTYNHKTDCDSSDNALGYSIGYTLEDGGAQTVSNP